MPVFWILDIQQLIVHLMKDKFLSYVYEGTNSAKL